jgi:N-acetyl-anhydromuramyl-L-alanine amidase AmpD
LLQPIAPNRGAGGSGGINGNNNGAPSPSTSNGAPSAAPSTLVVPRLQAPGTSLNGGGGSNGQRSTTRQPRVTLREQLIPYTNNPDDLFAPPKADRPWKYVVLHHSAGASGSYETIDREHRKRLGWDGCGYHFVIGNGHGSPDGQIEVARRWSEQKQGIHCRNGKNPDVSEYSVGICLIGDLDENPPTPRQVAAAQALVAYLGVRYRIPDDHIGTHAHLARTPTDCPGKHFPAQAILGSSNHLAQR